MFLSYSELYVNFLVAMNNDLQLELLISVWQHFLSSLFYIYFQLVQSKMSHSFHTLWETFEMMILWIRGALCVILIADHTIIFPFLCFQTRDWTSKPFLKQTKQILISLRILAVFPGLLRRNIKFFLSVFGSARGCVQRLSPMNQITGQLNILRTVWKTTIACLPIYGDLR